jgi:hypothetical protein
MSVGGGRRHRQAGMLVPSAIVMITLLFLVGTAMALAVGSSLQAVRDTAQRDATSYAAESGVASGTAASIAAAGGTPGAPCGPSSPQCYLLDRINSRSAQQLAIPEQVVPNCDPANTTFLIELDPLPALQDAARLSVWTVIGWQPLTNGASLLVWTSRDNGNHCYPTDAVCQAVSPTKVGSSFLTYFACPKSDSSQGVNLHIVAQGGPVRIGSFIVRAAQSGACNSCNDYIATVVGQAGGIVDESDVIIPATGQPTRSLWHTVLP